jgi:hypothetical protein
MIRQAPAFSDIRTGAILLMAGMGVIFLFAAIVLLLADTGASGAGAPDLGFRAIV